ncbi:hypothetical protein U9L70_06495 [Staphylococcus equorum]|uniref:hypothetical protein n=1 Tax=Staphylococcus equorum TaxID=246432 RepID=UPI003980E27F
MNIKTTEDVFKKVYIDTCKERDQYKAERDTLIDDLSWYKAKVSRLEEKETNWVTENGFLLSYDVISDRYKRLKQDIKRLEQRHSKLVDENTRLQNELYTVGLKQDEADDKVKEYKSLLSEISQHIGNKPSSSTYKYFRAKLDGVGIKVGD